MNGIAALQCPFKAFHNIALALLGIGTTLLGGIVIMEMSLSLPMMSPVMGTQTTSHRANKLFAQRWSSGGSSGSSRSRFERIPRHIVMKQLQASMKAKVKARPRPKPTVVPKSVQQQSLPIPPVNAINEEFVVFVRSRVLGERWLPITIMVGGPDADNLVKGAEGTTSPELYQNELLRSIGHVIYSDKDKIEAQIRKSNIAGIQEENNFEYGFKVRDKTKPETWMNEIGIVVLPPKDDLPTPVKLPPIQTLTQQTPANDSKPQPFADPQQ
eukprot:GGOE01004090.1.p1 GENE.GGOE01004090.1~~GGOE01004090.1.p1  ORF type:complete len:270 (-),score=51.45 GGOE01004090.1:68-877(-)